MNVASNYRPIHAFKVLFGLLTKVRLKVHVWLPWESVALTVYRNYSIFKCSIFDSCHQLIFNIQRIIGHLDDTNIKAIL